MELRLKFSKMGLKKINNKALSPVISTILLILLAVTSIVIIAGVLVPFIRNMLAESKVCFEAVNQLEIDTASGYTCYSVDANNDIDVKITIKRGSGEMNLDRFKIFISAGGSGKSFDIKTGETGVKMLSGSSTIEIPDAGEEKTYSIETELALGNGEVYAEVYPVMSSGKTCDAADKVNLEEC